NGDPQCLSGDLPLCWQFGEDGGREFQFLSASLDDHCAAQPLVCNELLGVTGGPVVVENNQRYRPDLDFARNINGHEIGPVSNINGDQPILVPFEDMVGEDDAADLNDGPRTRVEHSPINVIASDGGVPAWVQLGMAGTGTLIAFIAVALSIFTALSSNKTTRAQLRAYVMLDGAVSGDFDDHGGFTVAIPTKNFGATPAHDLTQWQDIALREYPLTSPLIPPDVSGHPNLAVLPPGGISLLLPIFKRGLEEWEKTAIKRCQLAIYVFGETRYVDAFGKSRTTKFCLRSTGEQAYSLGVFKAYREGNSYT
ncbi:MAG TPA: hypothetical protein VF982_12465, partial [Anaerolineales bacterium]